ncbi:AMP-binding protein [Rhodococcus sp. HNM0569]|uniref:AMP-binding protein n=1 Tax=Rhodococcus sp. HNM0569 TaxID=2716340 RepID=UPI00146DCE05|nr:AMP-binding protein [Rhodococcus sp. HNM0569]NLU83084.1 long-chain fatty acid--CoA ligase [Rhodococcus sp. HNM0569]
MPNIIDPVRRHAHTAPSDIALRGFDVTTGHSDTWTYRELSDASARFAGMLDAAGVEPGDRVLLLAPSVPEFAVAYFGIAAAGAVVVPVNTMSTVHELAYVLDDAGCALAVAWHTCADAVTQAATAAATPVHLLLPRASDTAAAFPAPVHDRAPDDTAAILYTSGTTGRPKGAQLTTSNLLSAGEIGVAGSGSHGADRTGTALPLFHVFGQASIMMATFTGGGSLSLLPRFDASAMLAMLRHDELTIMAGVPTMWNALLHAAGDASPRDFAQLRIAISGGASLPGEVAREFQRRFGCTLLEGYGLTETTAFGTFNDVEHTPRAGWTGRAAARTEVQVLSPDGEPCPTGTVGEVVVRGATVMKGYWNQPDSTAAAFTTDGWFRTGDLGELDDQGNLRIVDRVKDLVIRGGYNVYPSEVEEVLYAHPEIVEAAVVGIPDDYYGEEIAALVVPRADAALTADEVSAYCRERLSAYKIPRIVQFADALPKGATGKILKRAIDRDALRAPL